MKPNSPSLTRLDEARRRDHAFIEAADEVWFFHDYLPGKGYKGGPGNALLYDLKVDPAIARATPWRAAKKRRAIAACAAMVAAACPSEWRGATLVPTPPSKAPDDPGHDARMAEVAAQTGLDAREIVRQTRSFSPSHRRDLRPDIWSLTQAYAIDEGVCPPAPERLIILDDLLTTGRHFRAMAQVLAARFPAAEIVGLFIARREEPDPYDEYADLVEQGII